MKTATFITAIAASTALLIGGIMTGCATYSHTDEATQSRIDSSPQFNGEKFTNTSGIRMNGDLGKMFSAMKDFLFNKDPKATPENVIPVQPLFTHNMLNRKQNDLSFSRIGHSTLLVQMEGKFWLTDPVFSERVSPVQWAGPKRFHPAPISIPELPEIEGVIISHDHYDHLDHTSVLALNKKTNHFLVPLGIGDRLRSWGIDPAKITEFDWWENKQIGNVEIIATPAQHFSGRGLLDGDQTLWASWVIRSENHSVYFSGDTGYFPGFKEIGEKYGPFNYAFMECGAYNELWRDIHMMPEDTMQAFKDVKGEVLVPIHNGTFDLSTHAWFDPFEQIQSLAQQNNVPLLTPVMGEVVMGTQQMNLAKGWWEYMQFVQTYSKDEATAN